MKLTRNDQVLIRTGKDRGKRGPIVRVLPKSNRIVVEGVNLIKKHTKPSSKHPQGGIITMEAPIAASNVMIVCTECSKATKVGTKLTKDGPIRICRACGAAIRTNKKQ